MYVETTSGTINFSNEYSEEVDNIRKKMCLTSYYKYGSAKENFGKGLVDSLETHEKCIKKYKETKNKEYLLDAMNYLMFEFMYPQIDGTYYKPTESKDSAGICGISIKEMEELSREDY